MTDEQRNARYALAVLFGINLMNFFDRQIAGALLEPIRIEFGMNDAASAWVNTAFTLIYAVAGIPLGRLSDTWKRTRVIAIGVTFWSVLTATSGLAFGYWTYLFTRMGVGIGEASCAPAGQALIGDLYPARAPRARDGHLHDGSAARPVRLLPSERRHRRGVGLARRVLRRLRARTDSRRARAADPRACARGVGRRTRGSRSPHRADSRLRSA